MNLYVFSNIFICVCALIGFFYGVRLFFRPKKAVYAQMITLAVGCTALGRLYQTIRIFTIGDYSSRFHLGVLGVIGSLMFLFSANYGVMDGILDDGRKENRKYRIIPLAAPVLFAALYLVFFQFSDQSLEIKIMAFSVSCFLLGSSYYNLKHFIFPDVEYGIIRCMKTYNLLALVFEFLCMAEILFQTRELTVLTVIVNILMGLVLPMIVISVERGYKKWLT